MDGRKWARGRAAALAWVSLHVGVVVCGCGDAREGVVRTSDLGGTAGGSGAVDGGSGDAGVRAGDDADIAQTGSDDGDPPAFQGERGDPSDLDPGRVYLMGSLPGNTTSIYGGGCARAATGVPDWASPEEDRTTEAGYVGAVPCEASRAQLRVDGSIVYHMARRAVKVFFQEDDLPQHPEWNDVELVDCFDFSHNFHWVHPHDGRVVYSCNAPEEEAETDGDLPPLAHYVVSGGDDPVLPVEEGWIIQHLGYDEYALVTRRSAPGPLAVWDGDAETLTEVGDTDFDFTQIQAVRATADGFGLLIHEEATPPRLSLWQVSVDGSIERLGTYPTIDGYTVEACPVPGSASDVLPQIPRGCTCALDEVGAAVCIASPGDDPLALPGSPISGMKVLRFEPGASAAEVVFDVADYPPLEDVRSLFTGA